MTPVKPTFSNWKQFADGRQVATVRYSADDVYEKNTWYRSHRDFICALFREQGVEITRFAHVYTGEPQNPLVKEWGVVFSTMGGRLVQTEELYEAHAIMGVNARPSKEIQLGETSGNQIQGKSVITTGDSQTAHLVRESSDGGGARDTGLVDLRGGKIDRVGTEDPAE